MIDDKLEYISRRREKRQAREQLNKYPLGMVSCNLEPPLEHGLEDPVRYRQEKYSNKTS